jgi:hypothetical protein
MTDDDGQKWDSWETRKIKHDKYIDAMIEDMDKLSSRKKKGINNNNTCKKQTDILECMFILDDFT